MIQICVIVQTPHRIMEDVYYVQNSMTIRDIMNMIHSHNRVPMSFRDLIWNGRTLEGTETLEFCVTAEQIVRIRAHPTDTVAAVEIYTPPTDTGRGNLDEGAETENSDSFLRNCAYSRIYYNNLLTLVINLIRDVVVITPIPTREMHELIHSLNMVISYILLEQRKIDEQLRECYSENPQSPGLESPRMFNWPEENHRNQHEAYERARLGTRQERAEEQRGNGGPNDKRSHV